MNIFEDMADYRLFLSRLEEYLHPNRRAPSASARYERKSFPEGAFSLLCYCLMPNHYHLLLRQNSEVPLSDLMLSLASGYSKYFNKKYDRVGSLFQDQFKAVRVESNEQLLWVSSYIHQNPKVAGMVSILEEYPHSSYPEYLASPSQGLCDTKWVLEQFSEQGGYRKFVESSFDVLRNRKSAEGALLQF